MARPMANALTAERTKIVAMSYHVWPVSCVDDAAVRTPAQMVRNVWRVTVAGVLNVQRIPIARLAKHA